MQICTYPVLAVVVPHEGTWIEILTVMQTANEYVVVPHEGTWIEIIKDTHPRKEESVVPHEGTWIEILIGSAFAVGKLSRSPRGNVD